MILYLIIRHIVNYYYYCYWWWEESAKQDSVSSRWEKERVTTVIKFFKWEEGERTFYTVLSYRWCWWPVVGEQQTTTKWVFFWNRQNVSLARWIAILDRGQQGIWPHVTFIPDMWIILSLSAQYKVFLRSFFMNKLLWRMTGYFRWWKKWCCTKNKLFKGIFEKE